MGADDYIVKPFRPRYLHAMVNAVLLRTHASQATGKQPSVVPGKLILKLTTSEVHLRKEVIKLTQTECQLLYVLMKNAQHTLSSKYISQDVWGKQDMNTDRVRAYIRRLRDKLNDNPPEVILTEHGGGYRFVSPI